MYQAEPIVEASNDSFLRLLSVMHYNLIPKFIAQLMPNLIPKFNAQIMPTLIPKFIAQLMPKYNSPLTPKFNSHWRQNSIHVKCPNSYEAPKQFLAVHYRVTQ